MIYQNISTNNSLKLYKVSDKLKELINENLNNISVNLLNQKSLNEFKICIPKKYAREESSTKVKYNDVEKVPHYELYVEPQVGSSINRRNAEIYFKLPKSGKLVRIILYMDGGVGFDKQFHKYIIRETDELDRRIILGFCLLHEVSLVDLCYEPHNSDDSYKDYIFRNAADYKASMMPKRLKAGSRGNDYTYFYKGVLKPYEESNMFSNVSFI